eukprot:2176519-Rhodomonas_salina.1
MDAGGLFKSVPAGERGSVGSASNRDSVGSAKADKEGAGAEAAGQCWPRGYIRKRNGDHWRGSAFSRLRSRESTGTKPLIMGVAVKFSCLSRSGSPEACALSPAEVRHSLLSQDCLWILGVRSA